MKTRFGLMFALLLGVVLLIAVVVVGQQQAPPGPPPQNRMPGDRPHPQNMPNPQNAPNARNAPNPDPLADVMFPPDLILGHARQLGLTDDQKNFMRGEVQKTMTSFNELQWKLQDEMELLHETLKANSVNEQQALVQLNKVLDIEREIKLLHVGLGVRLKNRLTSEQQAQLQRMRMDPMRMAPGPPRPLE